MSILISQFIPHPPRHQNIHGSFLWTVELWVFDSIYSQQFCFLNLAIRKGVFPCVLFILWKCIWLFYQKTLSMYLTFSFSNLSQCLLRQKGEWVGTVNDLPFNNFLLITAIFFIKKKGKKKNSLSLYSFNKK